MGRLVDVRRRTELLDGVVAYLAERGSRACRCGRWRSRSASASTRSSTTSAPRTTSWWPRCAAPSTSRTRFGALTARNSGLSQAELLRRWWRWINSSSANLSMVRLGIEAAALDHDCDRAAGNRARRPDRVVAVEHRAAPDRRGGSGGRRCRRGVAREGDVHRPRRRPPRDWRAPPTHPSARGRPRPAGASPGDLVRFRRPRGARNSRTGGSGRRGGLAALEVVGAEHHTEWVAT